MDDGYDLNLFCLGALMTSSLQVMEAHFSRKMFKEHISAEKSLDLIKLKLTKGANFQVPTWGTKSEKKTDKNL